MLPRIRGRLRRVLKRVHDPRTRFGGVLKGAAMGALIGSIGVGLANKFFRMPPKPPVQKPAIVSSVSPQPNQSVQSRSPKELLRLRQAQQAREQLTIETNNFAKQMLEEVNRKTSVRIAQNHATISAKLIDRVLKEKNSPAAGLGQSFVKYGKQYGIAPDFIVAVFRAESNYGTKGRAVENKSVGNIRYTPPKRGINYSNNNGFRKYGSWEDGIKDFCQLISQGAPYRKLLSLSEILQTYSPPKENETNRHIENIQTTMNQLREMQNQQGK